MELTNKEKIELLAALAQIVAANNKSTDANQIRKDVVDAANVVAQHIIDSFRTR